MIKPFDKSCTACNACMAKCPHSAIYRKTAELGFYYPAIDESLCINCGMCDKVCPIEKEVPTCPSQKAFAAVHSNKCVINESTSGGVFSAVASWVFEHNGIVYGCAYDDNLKPIHIRVDRPEELFRLRGSKYVQSDTGNTFAEAETELKNGSYVLYSGTPCQIDGLKHFLGKTYERLICIDIICHGVASADYFAGYINYLEKKNNCKINAFSFRDKNNNGWTLSGTYSGTYSGTGKTFTRQLNYFDSYYYSYFLSGETYRESCYTCKYAQVSRVGDFTLGDLWGAEGLYLPFDVRNGCSVVLVNTEKASWIWRELQLKWQEIDIQKAIQYNAQLQRPSEYKESRAQRVNDYKNCDSIWIQRDFKKRYLKRNLIGRLKYSMPKPIKNLLLKLRYHG